MTIRWMDDFGAMESCDMRLSMKLEKGDFSFPVVLKLDEALEV